MPEDGGPTRHRTQLTTAIGPEASFDLTAVSGRETVYVVHAQDAGHRDSIRVQVFPSDTRSSFTFRPPGAAPVRTFLTVPRTLSPWTGVVVVVHGTERNADEYCDSWSGWAARHDRLVLCPRFDREDWPGARSFNLGNVFAADGGPMLPQRAWSFDVVTALHRYARDGFDISDERFDLWGHSAGAQFVHRYLLFQPHAPVRAALAANAGWYTVPDLSVEFPYGLRDPRLRLTRADVAAWTARDLALMRGVLDVTRDLTLRTTPAAESQGPSRYHRAGHMYRAGRASSPRCRWELLDVPDAGHDQVTMAVAAQRFLLDRDAAEPGR